MKQTREQIAYNFLKEAGPCILRYEQPDEGPTQILLSGQGEAFWLNEQSGPDNPLVTLDDVMEEAKHLILVLFTADMDTELDANKLFEFENGLRTALKNSELTPPEGREVKIKFLDVKESVLE